MKKINLYADQKIYYIAKEDEVKFFEITKVGRKYIYLKGGQFYWEREIEKEELLEELNKCRCVGKKFFLTKEECENIIKLKDKVNRLNQKLNKLDTKELSIVKVEAFLSFFEGIIENY